MILCRYYQRTRSSPDGPSQHISLGGTGQFSWVSQNMAPIPLQKIHWRSVQVRAAHGAMDTVHAAQHGCVGSVCLAALWSQGCL